MYSTDFLSKQVQSEFKQVDDKTGFKICWLNENLLHLYFGQITIFVLQKEALKWILIL